MLLKSNLINTKNIIFIVLMIQPSFIRGLYKYNYKLWPIIFKNSRRICGCPGQAGDVTQFPSTTA